jgi:flagellar hook-associated protein 2
MDLGISGLASNFDWKSFITQMIQVERAPEQRLRATQSTLQQRNNAYGSILTQLNVLNNKVDALKEPLLFSSRQTAVSDPTIASATAGTSAALGSYTFNLTQLASSAVQQGAVDSGKPISATNDVSGLVLGSAGMSSGITAGTFTVNGKAITIATTDTLQSVFDQINTATGGTVTGSYDAGTDKISLTSSGGPVVLGTVTDTSNFLQATKLFNNGTGTVTSSSALGGIHMTGSLAASNLATTVDDGGSGAGAFKINGVTINFDASTDSLSDVLTRISNSAAGVTASYDSVNDRFVLSNKTTGDVGIALEDVTGNFLAATGLSGGTLQRGTNLLYNINGGGTLTSQSNTITSDSSGLAGLAVTAFQTGTTTVTVGSDNAKIKSAITDFITEFNAVQNLVNNLTASSTDSSGKVTAGTLTGERDASDIQSSLRHIMTATLSGLTGTIKSLDSLGISSNGTDNTLALTNSDKLDSALASNLDDISTVFTDSTSGLAVKLSDYLKGLTGDDGSLSKKQTDLTKQSGAIDTTIEAMERTILADQQRMTDSFVAMEAAIASINQQGAYLTKTFGA